MIVERLFEMIDVGKSGKNIGIPTGMPKLDKITYGIRKEVLQVIAADTGIY